MPKKPKDQPVRYDVHRTLSTAMSDKDEKTRKKSKDIKNDLDDNNSKKKWYRPTWKKSILTIFLLILIPIFIIVIWDIKNYSYAGDKLFGSSNALSLLKTKQLEKNSNDNTNILFIGYSADDPGHSGALLTDSIMVLSLDKEKKQGKSLSIPRDLYVNIPDYGNAKINEAFQAGKRNGKSNKDGINLLSKVLSDNLGVQINYYVIIDYGAVKEIVNALGGIYVTIDSKDPRGIYDPNFKPNEGGALKLKNGKQKINGETALKLTRARGSTYGSYGFPLSDFDRTKNQQKVMLGIKEKLNWKLVLDPRKNKKILDTVADNIETNVKASEALPVYGLLNSIPQSDIKDIILNDINKVNYLGSYRTPSGQSALVPAKGVNDFSEIKSVLKKLGF